jgi:hypothetical protein
VIGGIFGDHRDMKTARVLFLCILCSVAAMTGCHGDSGAPPQAAPTPHLQAALPAKTAKKGPTAAELTKGMVEAVSQGKSQLQVQLKFDLGQKPTVGQPLDVDIAVVPQIDAAAVEIQITGGDGLTVAAGADQIALPAVQADEVYRQSFKVTPTAEGVLLLGLTVSLKHDEMTESRVFSIPVIAQR